MINVPEEKKIKALNNLEKMIAKRTATVDEMEKLAGLLNFLSKAIVPGRAFTRRMYAKFTKTVEEKNLRKYHHVTLDSEYKADCEMWAWFLRESCESNFSIARPFVDFDNILKAQEIYCYSDAAKQEGLGFGCILNSDWLAYTWEPGFITTYDPSIEFLELFAVCVGVFIWIEKLKNTRFTLFCDNDSAVKMLNIQPVVASIV